MENELYHHGIKGMKWGVRRTLEELGHKRKARRTQKKRLNALKKARKAKAKAQKEKLRYEERRKKYAKDPTLMSKHKDMFTTDELNNAARRFQAEQSVHDLSLRKINRGREVMGSLSGYLQTGLSIYDSVSKIAKILDGDSKLPTVESRSMKEAKSYLKKLENKSLSEIDFDEVNTIKSQLGSLAGVEGIASGGKKKNNN